MLNVRRNNNSSLGSEVLSTISCTWVFGLMLTPYEHYHFWHLGLITLYYVRVHSCIYCTTLFSNVWFYLWWKMYFCFWYISFIPNYSVITMYIKCPDGHLFGELAMNSFQPTDFGRILLYSMPFACWIHCAMKIAGGGLEGQASHYPNSVWVVNHNIIKSASHSADACARNLIYEPTATRYRNNVSDIIFVFVFFVWDAWETTHLWSRTTVLGVLRIGSAVLHPCKLKTPCDLLFSHQCDDIWWSHSSSTFHLSSSRPIQLILAAEDDNTQMKQMMLCAKVLLIGNGGVQGFNGGGGFNEKLQHY
jgi:hypothetical protein